MSDSYTFSDESIVSVIESFKRNEVINTMRKQYKEDNNNKWNTLYKFTVDSIDEGYIVIGDPSGLDKLLKPGEDAYMEKYFSNDPTAKWDKNTPKHKQGDWKYSLLPKDYLGSKSILKRAITFNTIKKSSARSVLANNLPKVYKVNWNKRLEWVKNEISIIHKNSGKEIEEWETFVKEIKLLTGV